MMAPFYEKDGITIYHGDCREILPTLPKADLVLTDPPYGIGLEEHGRNGYDWKIEGDDSQDIGNEILIRLGQQELPQIVFASPKKPWPGCWRQWLVWDKGPAVGGGGDRNTCWKFDWELIQMRLVPKVFGKRETSVLRFHVGQRDFNFHPCQKPVPLVKYLIGKSTEEGQAILDPFMGSGTTLVASKQLGRKAIGIEVDERYCEIAANRLAQMIFAFE